MVLNSLWRKSAWLFVGSLSSETRLLLSMKLPGPARSPYLIRWAGRIEPLSWAHFSLLSPDISRALRLLVY